MIPLRRGFVDVPGGQMFYREAGRGPALVLIHQVLRTSLDYEFVIPILARRHRVVAFDNMGCGDSDPAPHAYSLEEHADAVAAALDRLGIERSVLAGHHSGANQALELALRRPDLASAVVMSGLFYVEERERLAALQAKARALADPAPRPDGSHLLALWEEGLRTNWGKPRFPPDRTDLLARFFLEQVKTGPRRFELYVAVMTYDTSARLPLLRAPCLFIKSSDDIPMCADARLWRRDQPDAACVELEVSGGGELPRLYPEQWSAAIVDYLRSVA